MKVAIASVQVPFIRGGAETLAANLRLALESRGYIADIVTIPFKWYPVEVLLQTMLAGRMLDLTEVNGEKIHVVVAMKFPAYYLRHDHKVIWLMHQHRQAYDLWETEFGDLHTFPNGTEVRETIIRHDIEYLSEARAIYATSANVSRRLEKYCKLSSEPLYHPPPEHQKLCCESYDNFVFYPSRLDPMKRQRLLIEAARYLKSDMRIVIAGAGSEAETSHLRRLIQEYGLENRVSLVGFISDEEKRSYYAKCRCVFFGGYDEDYGYVTLEGFYSRKAVIALPDTGGALEFIEDGQSGYICPPDAKSLAIRLDELSGNRPLAEKLGAEAHATLKRKLINWDHVVTTLLKDA